MDRWGAIPMTNHINLIKLCVGTETPDDLARWQSQRRKQLPDKLPRHVTRMWPKREEEILDGGSIYWVIRGVILARQCILRLDEHDGGDGIRRCAIVLDPALVRVTATPRRWPSILTSSWQPSPMRRSPPGSGSPPPRLTGGPGCGPSRLHIPCRRVLRPCPCGQGSAGSTDHRHISYPGSRA